MEFSIEQDYSSTIPTDFTICALLYGNYFDLAKRCINSITQLPRYELRIGLNEVCKDTQDFVYDLYKSHIFDLKDNPDKRIAVYLSYTNCGKYHMMDRMFNDPVRPITSPYIMWFDDDSYITTPTQEWLDTVKSNLHHYAMCGSLHWTGLTNNQVMWIKTQPWYRGEPLLKRSGQPVVYFAVGGWWAIDAETIEWLNWPPSNIIHRGGDYMLGEALHQNGLHIRDFIDGVAINADSTGNSHSACRRGLDPLPVGMDYDPSLTMRIHLATANIDPKILGEIHA